MEADQIAPLSFRVSPHGHPLIQESASTNSWAKAFSVSTSEGIWTLATSTQVSDDTVRFWRSIGNAFLLEIAERQHLPSASERTELDLSDELLSDFVTAKPLCDGAEYITAENLRNLWSEMTQELREQLQHEQHEGNLAGWLETRGGQFGLLGKVCLHLAENKRSESHPFAFMATVALTITDDGRVIYSPLGRALEDAEDAGEKNKILKLLVPLLEASQNIPWLSLAIAEKDIYGAQIWTSHQAHSFLKSLPALNDFGIRVRVPDWWSAQSAQVKAKVVIDKSPGTNLGATGLLQFDVSLALGDESLSAAEIDEILSSSEKFVRIRGKWVEIDKEKLQQTLAHWKKASDEVKKNGLTWHQGMRLLSGSNDLGGKIDQRSQSSADTFSPNWTEVIAGAGIQKLLSNMISPSASIDFNPGSMLKARLRPYQEKGVAWLGLLSEIGLGACLADDMGLGKTIQVLALLLCIQKKNKISKNTHRSLLVAPASLLANWLSEARKFAPSINIYIDHAAFKNDGKYGEAELVVTTYGTLTRAEKFGKEQWNLVVLDEAQAIKTPHTAQTRAVKSLRSRARIALTGTPIENRLMDLWSLFDFLNPGLLSTQEHFQKFVNPKGTAPRLSPLRSLTQPYILRRLKTDRSIIDDLPDKTETLAWCVLSKQQIGLYSQSVQEFKMDLEAADGLQRSGIVLGYLLRFKQICNHPSLALGAGTFDPKSSGKFTRLQELAEEIAVRQEKLLVFTQYREMCPVLALWLREIFGREGLVLDGSTAISKRRALVEAFQSENGPPFFVLSLKAGGTGLTLTAANHVIHFDRWWNPAVENQATDRAFRIGQKRNVLVHKFVCRGTLEEKIDEMMSSKKGLSDGVLGGGKEVPFSELSNTELLKLVSLDLNSINADEDN